MKFPHDMQFGVATAAYQIEGNAKGGAGPSHWDTFAKQGGTVRHEDGAIACDHVTHWKNDLNLISNAGFDSYRFSFSWPRLLPDGSLNAQGVDFYDRLIDGMLARDLMPSATLYHWDMPAYLADKGGWLNPDSANWLADLADLVGRKFGDRLGQIATINEPWCVSWLSHYLGHHAPGLTDLKSGVHSMHNILKAHGRAMSALRAVGSENLGIVLNMEYANPADDDPKSQRAARIYDGIYNRWFIQALTKGTYPEDVLEHFVPHMPDGWEKDMAEIQQPLDWLGLNYYTRTNHADDGTDVFPFNTVKEGPLDKTAMGWEVYPEGLHFFLERITRDYTGPLPLYVSENGMAADDHVTANAVQDDDRIAYFKSHISAALAARDNGVPLKGFYAWSLMDNFEWAFGFDKRFGIVHVDYATQKRLPKASYHWFADALRHRRQSKD